MQLILALAVLLLLGGKSGGKSRTPQISSSDMVDILKYISNGNDEMDKIIQEVEQVSEIISAFAPLAGTFSEIGEAEGTPSEFADESNSDGATKDIGLYLKPISNIADSGIYNALSHAIA